MKKKLFSIGLAAVSLLPAGAQDLKTTSKTINVDSVYNLPPNKLYQFIKDAHKRDPIVEVDTILVKSDNDIYQIDGSGGFYEKNLNLIKLPCYQVSPDGKFQNFTAVEMEEIIKAVNQEIPFREKHERDHAAKYSILNYASLSTDDIVEIEIYFELGARIAEFLAHRDTLIQTNSLPLAFPLYSLFYKTNYLHKKHEELFNTPLFWTQTSKESIALQKSLGKNFKNYSSYIKWLFENKQLDTELQRDECDAIVLSQLVRFNRAFKLYIPALTDALLENIINGEIARTETKKQKLTAKPKSELIKFFWTFDDICVWDIISDSVKAEVEKSIKQYVETKKIKKHIAFVTKNYPQYLFTNDNSR